MTYPGGKTRVESNKCKLKKKTWSNLNNNKLINEKLICACRWSVLPSIMKMHGPKNKVQW